MTDWNQRYLQGETPWDKGRAAPPLLELLQTVPMADHWYTGEVLVPGCGAGHDVRALAAEGLKVVGLDISSVAIGKANAHRRVNGERYRCGDLFDPTVFLGESFSGWWEHTCFCAIDPSDRPRYAAAAGRLIHPGGWLCGVFFLTPNDPGEEADGPPFNASIGEIDALFQPWFERLHAWIPACTFPGREGREWTACYRRRTEPA